MLNGRKRHNHIIQPVAQVVHVFHSQLRMVAHRHLVVDRFHVRRPPRQQDRFHPRGRRSYDKHGFSTHRVLVKSYEEVNRRRGIVLRADVFVRAGFRREAVYLRSLPNADKSFAAQHVLCVEAVCNAFLLRAVGLVAAVYESVRSQVGSLQELIFRVIFETAPRRRPDRCAELAAGCCIPAAVACAVTSVNIRLHKRIDVFHGWQ
mmetsp:Transcript_28952/g.71472  ORF Transcript_28952/g.71472 Transcript_28952/m.71472 type:complete len:205 (+) Transcript_28952:785-1399(+)